jgi:hypothetical protein
MGEAGREGSVLVLVLVSATALFAIQRTNSHALIVGHGGFVASKQASMDAPHFGPPNHAAFLPHLCVQPSVDYVGGLRLVAKRHIQANEPVLSVPSSGIFRASSLDSVAHHLATSPDAYCRFLRQRPRTTAFADVWTDGAVEATGDALVLSEVVSDARAVAGACRQGRDVFWLAQSRVFALADAHQLCLVPYADLLDHDPRAPIAYTLTRGGGFELVAHKPLAPGEPVLTSYGPRRTNADLLATHGFCVDPNPHESVLLLQRYLLYLDAPCWEAVTNLGVDEYVAELRALLVDPQDFGGGARAGLSGAARQVEEDMWASVGRYRDSRQRIVKAQLEFAQSVRATLRAADRQ